MQQLNLPPFNIKVAEREGQTTIYDFLRHRYIRLTPEEWVRQHFTHFLVEHKGYPTALLANEVTIDVNGVARRCDSVLYKAAGGMPRMIIEYKAPHIHITQSVFQQIYSYNSVLRADYLIVSNGINHYCCHVDYDNMRVDFLKDIPNYIEL
mgnify:FL=1|jgi:hypothetical protein|uniref:type I restriction enzyme HsdR N-terminal domain-containing protein n=1 Tax=Alloprevotella sp. TaxID=1872471 RepID=UPI004027461B